jgi:hypothetical protein
MRTALAPLHVFVYNFFRSDLPPGTRDGMPVVLRRFIQCVRAALGLIFIWVIGLRPRLLLFILMLMALVLRLHE